MSPLISRLNFNKGFGGKVGKRRFPTYSVSPDISTVNEGSTVTFTVTTTNVGSGTTLYWTTNVVSGTVNGSDFSDSAISGSFTTTGNRTTITRTLARDATTEGSESFQLQIRTGSTSGAIVATSSTVTISDTSLDPTYSVSPDISTVNEGSTVTFTVTTTDVTNATTLYWTTNVVSGTVNGSDFSDSAISGSFTINNNTGSVSRTLTADSTTEGSESFQIQIRTGSTSGTIVATSSTVTISDTSINPYRGGTITTSDGDRIHTFTTSGILTATYPISNATVLVVSGGGGGGRDRGSGGGGGGINYQTNISFSTGNYTVTIGGGGGGQSNRGSGGPGSPSRIVGVITSFGGSGGGGQIPNIPSEDQFRPGGPSGLPQNNAGGLITITGSDGGGGGGAGGVGGNAAPDRGGNGGPGLTYSISGSPVTYAGGGGGWGSPIQGSGGPGGGTPAQNGDVGVPFPPAPANSGGGGGGNEAISGGPAAGAGGSGIIIIRYPI